jgi:rRNA maturation endonuclease Nob1
MTLTKRGFRRLITEERADNSLKTAHMFRLEVKYQTDIYQLLNGAKSGRELAKEFNVTESCISKWRKRLGIQVLQRQCYHCTMVISYATKLCPHCGGVV